MNSHANPGGGIADLQVGQALAPLVVEISEAANDRSWAGAGIEHPARAAGTLYPPFAANLTIMAVQQVVERPLLHTAQHLACHRSARAGVALTVRGAVAERYEKRGRDYAVIDAVVHLPDGATLWTSRATFTEVR